MVYVLIGLLVLIILVILAAFLTSNSKSGRKENWPGRPYPHAPRDPASGLPYPPSKELRQEMEEEQQRRQELVRLGGVEALSTYLKITK